MASKLSGSNDEAADEEHGNRINVTKIFWVW